MYKFPIYRPYLYGNEKDYVNQCLDSTWISSKGEFIDKFEAEFSNYVGAGGVVVKSIHKSGVYVGIPAKLITSSSG